MARRFDDLRLAGAVRLVPVALLLLAVFLLLPARRLLPGRRLLLAFFFELRADLPAVFLLDFDLAFEADFFLVTVFRASFRLGFDLAALAVFLRLVFFLLVFLLVFVLLDFFVLVFFGAFSLAFFLVAARLREDFFAGFFETRFFDVAFLVGMRIDPGWLQMQPAIIHRSVGCGSPSAPHFSRPEIQGSSTGRAASKPGSRCSATTVV